MRLSLRIMMGACWLLLDQAVAVDATPFVVRVEARSDSEQWIGTGVILASGHVLTAKHVTSGAKLLSVVANGTRTPAEVIAETQEPDGAVILSSGVLASGLPICTEPPPRGSPVTLYGLGGDGRLVRQDCELAGSADFTIKGRRTRLNLTSCSRISRGDSGGPVMTAAGDVMAVILAKEGQDGACAVSACADLNRVYATVSARGGQPVITDDVVLYSSPRCGACITAKQDFKDGRYSDLGVGYRVHDLATAPAPEVRTTPSFRLRGVLWQPDVYSVEATRQWIRGVLSSTSPAAPLVRLPEEARSAVPDPVAPVVDIDWSGVRFGVMLSDDAPAFLRSRYLLGPIQRLLDVATGGTVPVEVFGESENPDRYAALAQSIGIARNDSVYTFATVDSITDVGLLKQQILKKILDAFDDKVSGETYTLLPDLIFKRSSPRQWKAVIDAMGLTSDNVVPDDDRSMAAKLIAFLFSLMGSMKAVRAARGFVDYQKEKWFEHTPIEAS